MSSFVENLKVGDVFRTRRGWWIRITGIGDKIEGYFACDEVSIEWPLCLFASYWATWNRAGQEIKDPFKEAPFKPCFWLDLEPDTD
ncbi:MAG: hypothetical protein FJZ04_02030 [Candidatus Moranbacteria bacterium]|nr:hypothetical protein [Candidatus Moranbacteria bacterium]